MAILLVKDQMFIYESRTYYLNDMFTNEIFDKCNEIVNEYNSDLCIINEVFLNRIQPYKAVETFLKDLDINTIVLKRTNKKLISIVIDYAKNNNIKIIGVPLLYKFRKISLGHFNIITSTIFLLLKIFTVSHTQELKSNSKNISLIRTPASEKKMSFLNNVDFRYEDFKHSNSIYKSFTRKNLFNLVIKSWLHAYNEIIKYVNFVRSKIGFYNSYDSYEFYSKRIVHTLLYSSIIDRFLSENEGAKFYTGNNLDRYAIIEENTAKKHNTTTVCIPHGLEYGFKLPHCFTGDVFYATSELAASKLNHLYNTNKFLYDISVVNKMFSVESSESIEKIVFFTEPREIQVNYQIIDVLLPFFENLDMKLSIKLHPKDDPKNYKQYKYRVDYLDDYSESVSNNICFSRKSTALLESIYNGSKSAAVLINNKDIEIFNTFPSLQDDMILKFYNIIDLFNWIKSEWEKNK